MNEIKYFKIIKENMEINHEAIKQVELLLESLKSGETQAVAFTEAQKGGRVSTFAACGNYYHQICSGCARLLRRVSSMEEGVE
jgi:hypothetical protein